MTENEIERDIDFFRDSEHNLEEAIHEEEDFFDEDFISDDQTVARKVKIDKIFENTYGEGEYDTRKMSFSVDASALIGHANPEDELQYQILFEKIHEIILISEYVKFNKKEDGKKMQKLNKVQINQVYGYVTSKLCPKNRKIDIFSILSDYFDIYPAKFYSSLSNKYKNDLILELDKALDILKKKKIQKLF